TNTVGGRDRVAVRNRLHSKYAHSGRIGKRTRTGKLGKKAQTDRITLGKGSKQLVRGTKGGRRKQNGAKRAAGATRFRPARAASLHPPGGVVLHDPVDRAGSAPLAPERGGEGSGVLRLPSPRYAGERGWG